MRLGIAPAQTALAFDERIGAVQLDQPRRARAREAVQTVNILRHHHFHLARFFQPDDGPMDVVRLSVAKRFPGFEFMIPMFDPLRNDPRFQKTG